MAMTDWWSQLTMNGKVWKSLVLIVGAGTTCLFCFAALADASNTRSRATQATTDTADTYVPYGDGCNAMPAAGSITFNSYASGHEEDYLREVHECTLRFDGTLLGDARSIFNADTMERLQCAIPMTKQYIKKVLETHSKVLFIGDSVIRQQFFTMLCMLNPDVQEADMVVQEETEYTYLHHYHDERHGGSMTAFRYVTVGHLWKGIGEHHLFSGPFPHAVKTYTENDAIVFDESRHWDHSIIDVLLNVTNFLAINSQSSQAPIYYMEPTIEEWPTTNGQFTATCINGQCVCEKIDAKRLDGHGYLDPNLAADHINLGRKAPSPGFFMDIPDEEGCVPSCLPATWRMQQVRKVFASVPNKLVYVPTFWQLMARKTHTARLQLGDCTHRNFDSLVMMNEQLIRNMGKVQQRGAPKVPALSYFG